MFNDASAYDRFMGRYSIQLSPQLADLAEIAGRERLLDVGAGTGVLTSELVRRVGAANVSAVEPSAGFVAALRERLPGVDIREAPAEELPFRDGEFDAALAQLVVHFMSDPVAGLAEMSRVTRPGGLVVACSWDEPMSDASPLSMFWRAARTVDPNAPAEEGLPGTREGDLARLFGMAGLVNVEQTELWVSLQHATFDDWWAPYEDGTGPAGRYLAALDSGQRGELRRVARRLVTTTPFEIRGRAWAARGSAPG